MILDKNVVREEPVKKVFYCPVCHQWYDHRDVILLKKDYQYIDKSGHRVHRNS